jgi:hypothetical protein
MAPMFHVTGNVLTSRIMLVYLHFATLAHIGCVASMYRPLTGPPCIVQPFSWELAQLVEKEMEDTTLGV